MKSKFYLAAAFFLLLGPDLFSQKKEFEFKNFTQENGLPSNESYFVYRDSKDFLWFATDQGVVRFNGNKMEYFSLPDNVVFKIREDSKGRIWFFSHSGRLFYFFNGHVYPYKFNNNIINAVKSILILDAYITDNDEVIITSGVGEHLKILGSGIIEKIAPVTWQPKDKSTFHITQINKKQIFAQASVYQSQRMDTVYIQVKIDDWKNNYVFSWPGKVGVQYGAVISDTKELFFFHGNCIVKLNADGSFKIKYFPYEITCATGGEQIWVGFKKAGVVALDTQLNEVYTHNILTDKTVTSIRYDYEGGVWFSTLEKGIFFVKNTLITRYTGDSTLAGPVFRLHKPTHDSLLFANTTGIYKIAGNKILPVFLQNSTKVNDLFTDQNKNLHMGGTIDIPDSVNAIFKKPLDISYKDAFVFTAYSELAKLPENKYLSSNYYGLYTYFMGPRLTSARKTNLLSDNYFTLVPKPGILLYDKRAQLWFGTMDGLYQINLSNNSPTRFKAHDPLLKKGITAMQQMDNGTYCIGIRFGGIAFMKDTSIIATISEKDGLLSNSIKYLLPLKDQLWVATPNGISVIQVSSYHPLKYTITNIGKNEGLYNLIIYQLMEHNKKILLTTSNGIYEIDSPEKLLKADPKPIPLYINSINYYKGDTAQVSSITLPYKHNRLLIRYSAVCYDLPEEINYYYRYANSDTTWQKITGTELVMENLIPGTYDLEIKAAIPREGRYSTVQNLQVIIEKPWWQNNWLRLAGLVLLIGIIILFAKRRINKITHRQEQEAALHTRMVELEQTALRSQMNPHFIFNCLTSIQQLIVTGNKDEANEYLVKFARLIRKTLELSGSSLISVAEEIAYLNEYLVLEQLRIPGQFEFVIKIDPDINTNKTQIPNMMLQPIVENSIRHGIKHLENKKGYITVSLQKLKDNILCTITDNGVGRKKYGSTANTELSENKSYGMDIVNKRLQALSIDQATMLYIQDLYNPDGTNAGTKVTVRLPYKEI